MSKTETNGKKARIFYARVDEFWRKGEKYVYLEEKQHVGNVEWQEVQPDAKHNWLTEGMQDEFETFMPLGSKEAKASDLSKAEVMFKSYGRGVATCRDVWTYNFDTASLAENMKRTIETYNDEAFKWTRVARSKAKIDSFVTNDETKISWSEGLKNFLNRGLTVRFDSARIRRSLYRPFSTQHLYFDAQFNERRYQMPYILPSSVLEEENKLICVPGAGGRTGFWCLCSDLIPNLSLISIDACQCLPFYTYNEDGTNRRENITDWALGKFREHYNDSSITKWDIFHYVYAVLHHPVYRERYAANLKRELPRIPCAPPPQLPCLRRRGRAAYRNPRPLRTAAGIRARKN